MKDRTSGTGGYGKRIKELRTSAQIGLSQEKFAASLDIGQNTLSRYESGAHEVPAAVLDKAIKATGCSSHWLLTGKGEMFEGESAAVEGIPIHACASAADPNGVCMVVDGHVPYGDEDRIYPPKALHAVKVHGDSMMPVALDGQYVLVADLEPKSGDLAVIECKDGRIMFKRVAMVDGIVSCGSLNPDPKYTPIILHRREIRRMRKIVGVWMGKLR